MKKISVILGLFVCIQAKSQIINPGFETWTTDVLVPTAMNPNSGNNSTGWWDYNMFHYSYIGSSPLSVFRCDTSHSGSFSAKIETVIYTAASYSLDAPWGIPFIGHKYLDTLGILFNGTTNEPAASFKPGIPFTQKINQFSFWYQYKPNGIDTAECRVLLVNNHNPVGGGSVKINTSNPLSWQQATITLSYVSSLTPDTLYVLFSSSSLDKNPKAGSVFLVDDVSVTYLTGIDQIDNTSNKIWLYPNPNTGNFILETEEKTEQNLKIMDMQGNLVWSQVILGKTLIETKNLADGIYNVSVLGKNGVMNRRIIICK